MAKEHSINIPREAFDDIREYRAKNYTGTDLGKIKIEDNGGTEIIITLTEDVDLVYLKLSY